MRSRRHVVSNVLGEHVLKPGGTHYDDVIEALPSDQANESLECRGLAVALAARDDSSICIAVMVNATSVNAVSRSCSGPAGLYRSETHSEAVVPSTRRWDGP